MSWHREATKDAGACEKLRGAGNQALIRRCPNGETRSRFQKPGSLTAERIGGVERTRGTETSQYPQEQKETSIPSVAASERGDSPNRDSSRGYGSTEGLQSPSQPNGLERPATAGDSPVGGGRRPPIRRALQSSAGLVEPRVKSAGPPAKAEYSSMTDSAPVGRLNDEKYGGEPCEKYLKPCTYERSEPYAPSNGGT